MSKPYSQMTDEERRAYKREADRRCKERKRLEKEGKEIPPELQKKTPPKQRRFDEIQVFDAVRDDGPLVIEERRHFHFNPLENNGVMSFKVDGLDVWFDVAGVLESKDDRLTVYLDVMSRDMKDRTRYVKSPRVWSADVTDMGKDLRRRNFYRLLQPRTAAACHDLVNENLDKFLEAIVSSAEEKKKLAGIFKARASSDEVKGIVAKMMS